MKDGEEGRLAGTDMPQKATPVPLGTRVKELAELLCLSFLDGRNGLQSPCWTAIGMRLAAHAPPSGDSERTSC